MMEFRTLSGSTYEVLDDMSMIRRADFTHGMRRDGEWLRIDRIIVPFEVGNAALFFVEPLGDLPATLRRTSEIIGVKDSKTQDTL